MGFGNKIAMYMDPDMKNFPTKSPLLAVGTYSLSTGNSSQGFTIVFDTDNRGKIYSALGSSEPNVLRGVLALELGVPVDVDMNGIFLTKEAIPVTMTSTGYIPDKAPDGSTVVYSITPNVSTALNRVPQSGNTLRFSPNMATAALKKQILTYSVSPEGIPYFNIFDPDRGIWSGGGLISSKAIAGDDPATVPIKLPLGIIIGGVIGGLVVIGIASMLIVRYLRSRNQNASSGNTDKQHGDKKDECCFDRNPQDHSLYTSPSSPSNAFEANSMEFSPHGPQFHPTIQVSNQGDTLSNPQQGSPSPWCDGDSPLTLFSKPGNPQTLGHDDYHE
ncbi:hypothetical protein BGX23_012159 [Mortierella sp. AD031]|nr:hypothetical protein BGX23_012159 [Mortierella sp. AD031]